MNLFGKAWRRIVNEPAVIVAVVIAGANAATSQTWQGYAAAVATALVRFFVYGPVTGTKADPAGG